VDVERLRPEIADRTMKPEGKCRADRREEEGEPYRAALEPIRIALVSSAAIMDEHRDVVAPRPLRLHEVTEEAFHAARDRREVLA
jgi:hypothetical protein